MTTVNLKTPYVVLERLCLQDVAGLKLPRSPEYKTLCPSPSTKGARDSSAKESRTRSPSARGTDDGSVYEGRWLKEQNETTKEQNTSLENGAQAATKDGESCRPGGEEGSKEHHCFRCSMNFPNSDTLVLHLKSHGPVRRSCTLYEKEVCGTSLDDSGPQNRRTMTSTLEQGESSPHSEGSRFPCNVCDKVFMQTNHLQLHMKTHSESKTDKEQGTGSDENSPRLNPTDFIKMMKTVIQDTAIKCFADAFESNNLPSSSDEALNLVRIRAHKALEQYKGLMDLKGQREDDLEQILQNLDDDSLDIKQEEDDDYDDGNGGELDENVVPVNSHNESSSCQNSLQSSQANIKSNLGNESSVRVPAHTSASAEIIKAYTVTDIFPRSVQNVLEPKKFTGVTRNAQESKKFSENVQNVQNKISSPRQSSVPDTSKGITTKVSPSKKYSPVGSVPPKKPGQSSTDTSKTTEGGENTTLTTYETLMLRKSKKLFSCHICHKPFGLQSHLKLHQQNVHGIKQSKQNKDVRSPKREKENKQQSYQSNIKRRSQLLNREQDLKLHLNAHQQEGPFNCTVCDKVFSEEYILKRHMKSHSEGLLYNCTKCEKAYELNEDLLLHMSREHPVTKHSPKNSNTTPISNSGSHTGVSLHVCVKCNLQFPTGTALNSHLHTCPSSVLEREKELDSSSSSMKFPDDISPQQHVKLNPSRLLLKCSRCDLKFPNGHALQSHMKHHGTRSPVSTHSKCSKCQLKFSTDALLERHMKRSHSMFQSGNQHICCKCGQKFNNQALLVRHMRLTHSPELEEAKKVLTCSTCGMKFSDGSSLHSHMKHHTSFVQISAELCDPTVPQNDVPVKLSPDSKVKSMQRDKLQNLSTSVDNTATSVQCSQRELQPYVMLHRASELESQYSEVNHTQQSSAKDLQPSPKTQEKVMLVTKEMKSNPIPVPEKSRISSHSTETFFECSQCNIQFVDIDSLQIHMKLNHTPSLPNPKMNGAKTSGIRSKHTEIVYECSNCSRMFETNASLQNHIKTLHSPMPESTNILKCLRCHKEFNTSSQFRSHLRTHRRKVCPKCGKLFTTQSSLAKHMCLHTGQLSYKCDTCSSQFSSSILFQKHLEWHDADAHLAVDNRGSIQKQTKTGDASQSVAPSASFQNAPYSSSKINNVKHFANGDSKNTSHDHLDEENLVTIDDDDDDDDIIILSDDENVVNTESHNSDELDEINDEIMMILDESDANHFKELSSKHLSNRTPNLSIGVQTDVVLSNKPTAFLTNNRNTINSNLHIADGIKSFKRAPLDTFKLHGGVDHSSSMVGAEIVNNSTLSSRELPSSVGRCESPDTSSALSSINGSVSDSQDSVQLENYETVKSPKASPKSSNRKRVLKDANQLVGPQQKKGKMLRVSFADDVSDRASDASICSEDLEKAMPKLLPEKIIVDSSKNITPQNNVKHPSLLKNCSVSLTKLKDGRLGSNASKISTVSNKTASEELLKKRESTRNRISRGKKINNKDELQTFNECLKTDDHDLSLSAKSKNTSPSKKSNKFVAKTLLHYDDVVNSSCEEETGHMMNTSYPMATSTPLTNKINHIRTTDSAVHSAKAENLPEKDGNSAEDMGSQNKLGLSHNVIPHDSENRNGKSASIDKEKLEPPKPTYTRKKKYSRLKVGRFKCKVCHKVFQSLPHLRVHKKTHAGQLIHKCPICNDRFPLRFLLGLHVADHFEKGIPRMISENELPSLNNSATSISKNIAPTFHIPKKKTASTTQDSNAAAATSFSGVFSRSNASGTTIDGPTIQSNSLAENQSLPSVISEDYSSALPPFDNSNESVGNYSSDYQFHQNDDSFGYSPSSKRNKKLEFACENCDMRFTQPLKLKMHQSIHTGIGLYKCSYCDLMFHFKPSLLSHVETHSGDKKFACKYCGRQFDDYSVMVRHRAHHKDGKRPLKCPDCPRTFALESTLRAHMQLHIRRALYRCTFCNCSFSVKANFQQHIVVHTGKKPYICKICKITFNRVDACRKHISLVHVAKNEITLESTQTLMDFVQIDKGIYKELQAFVQDVLSKTRLGGEGKSELKSTEDSTVPIDKELPEPILVESVPLNDSFRKEICKAKANCTLSDIYSPDMNKKERYEKLCVEVRNVLTRMKRYPQIPIMNPSSKQSYLETPTRQIRDPRLKRSLNLSENRSPNNHSETSTIKQATSVNLNNSSHKKHSPKGSVVQKSSNSANLDKKYKKTVQLYKDVIVASKGQPCKYCGEIFGKRYMKTHELTHKVGGDILCSFCDKKFTTRTGLRYHLALHADVRPYPCSICGRAFKLKHQMYSHVRTHSRERNHKCKICSKSFFSKGNLNIHILSHIPKEDWPFKCHLCDQRFPTKYRLMYHTNRHSKVKSYECPVCYRKFSDKSSADRHVRTLHEGRNHLSTSIAESDEPITA